MKEITEEDIYNWIGEDLGDVCPRCGYPVLTDKTGTKWCSKCTWSNDPDFEKDTIKFFGKHE